MPFLVIEKNDKAQYVTFEDDQDVDGLVNYAQQKLSQEQERYEVFEQNYQSKKI